MPFDDPVSWVLISVFFIGYFLITIEHVIGINKATSALLMGVIAWVIVFTTSKDSQPQNTHFFGEHLSNIAEVVIFLIGVLTIVEVINSHDGFRMVSNFLRQRSKKKMLWVIGLITFVLSAVLGSITMTIVMVALIAKIASNREDRWLLGSGAVLAANAGGAFSPIGDITTTMLWIGGQLSSFRMMVQLALPSFFCMATGLLCLQPWLKGDFQEVLEKEKPTTLSKIIFFVGLSLILFVPIFKGLTGLPPFMGILLGVSILWLLTDLLHLKHEDRHHLLIPNIIGKLDFGGPLFFLGILLAVSALDTAGVLKGIAEFLNRSVSSPLWLASGVGIVSAVIDNVPLVAALMGMFSLEAFPQDHPFWQLVAYSAGVGGSILIFGSAPGVAFMGMEKVRFGWYLKHVSLPALIAFVVGLAVFHLQSIFI